jgi:sterol desaturase/sphingolipid hydroxylase (fatty acid hydroxylase superfamily)
MATDALARIAVAWCLFVAWTALTFTALEWLWPRRSAARPALRRVVGAAALLAVDVAIALALSPRALSSPAAASQVALAWVFAELFAYGAHRAMHAVPLLWRCHRLHHDGAPLAWTAAWRVHPVDAALFALAALLGGVVAGAPVTAAGWLVVARRIWTVVLHANVAWPASALDQVIATPAFHDRHHDETRAPANFASTLPLLDWIFGTRARQNRYAAPSTKLVR